MDNNRTLVVCGVGHETEPGYIVCKHVAAGAPPQIVWGPDVEQGRMGIVVCGLTVGHTSKEMAIQCAECCRVKGWVQRDRRLRTQGIRGVLVDGGVGGGFQVSLACNHTVWSAVDVTGWPGLYCGACMGELAAELRLAERRAW